MYHETMLHITEDLSPELRETIIERLQRQPGIAQASHHSQQPHLLFVGYDDSAAAPHDVVATVREAGLHAQLVDL